MITVVEKLKAVNNGGIEAFAFGAAGRIKDTDIDIEFYSDKPKETSKYDEGYKITVSPRDYSAVGAKGLRVLYKWLDFHRYCREKKPDVIHLHMSRPYDIVYVLGMGRSCRAGIILHSHFSKREDNIFIERTMNTFFRLLCRKKGDYFLACSEDAAEYMFGRQALGTENCIIVKNGIDTEKFAYDSHIAEKERKLLGISEKGFVIGIVARLVPSKNHSFLLDVFAELCSLCDDAVLLIVGSGPSEGELKAKTEKLGLSDKVIFYGAADNAHELYQAMDCFVFPSEFEGFGISVLEAQAAGLRTYCSGGVPRTAAVTELCSFMPSDASPKEWAENIMSHRGEYLRSGFAVQAAEKGYDIKDTSEQLKELYRLAAVRKKRV